MSTDLVPASVSGPPSPAEWRAMTDQAAVIARSGLAPRGVDTPEKVLTIALKGRELGIPPMQALSHIHVIEGKPALSAELMVALVQRAGHKLRVVETDNRHCIVEGVRRDDPDSPARVEFTLEDAQLAGVGSKSVWKSYPAAMCRARAISALCRFQFADVLMGASYTPEELGADVDFAEGAIDVRPIDELDARIDDLIDACVDAGIEVNAGEVRLHAAKGEQYAQQSIRILEKRLEDKGVALPPSEGEDVESPAPADPPQGQPAPSDEEVDRAPEPVKPADVDAAPEGEDAPAGEDPAGASDRKCEGTRHVGPLDRIGIARTRCRGCGATGGPDGPGTPEPKTDEGAPADAEPAPTESSWRTVCEDLGVPPVAVVAALVKAWPKNDQAARPNNLKDVDRLAAKPEYRDVVRATIEDIAAERQAAS